LIIEFGIPAVPFRLFIEASTSTYFRKSFQFISVFLLRPMLLMQMKLMQMDTEQNLGSSQYATLCATPRTAHLPLLLNPSFLHA